jgi:hypothetical protein
VACKRSNKDKRAAAKANEVPEEQIMNFDAMHSSLYEELFHRTGAECLLHLSAKDETCAAVAIQKQIKYVGVTFSELHSLHLLRRVEQTIFFSFLTPDGAFLQARLSKAMGYFLSSFDDGTRSKSRFEKKDSRVGEESG